MKIYYLIGILLYYGFFNLIPDRKIFLNKYVRKIKANFLHLINKNISKKCIISNNVYLGNLLDISIGDYSYLAKGFKLNEAILTIGKDVMFGPYVTVQGGGHKFNNIDIPMRLQGSIKRTYLFVEDDVWIGTNSLILAKNNKISKGTIIGAGTVLTKDTEEYSIMGGNPAKLIKYRNN